jgi:hypothetical protein
LYLFTFGQGLLAFCSIMTQYQMQPFMGNAVFTATSPSDFWGRKWNLLVHDVLKQGVYKPVRCYSGSSMVGTCAAFLASGLFHEWLVVNVGVILPHQLDAQGNCRHSCFPYTPGATLVFFVWQAMLVAGEGMIQYYYPKCMPWMAKVVPRPFLTVMVVALGIPMAHWFIDPYIHSDFFVHGRYALPMILIVK